MADEQPAARPEMYADIGGARRKVATGTIKASVNDGSQADVTLETPGDQDPVDLTAEIQIIASVKHSNSDQPDEYVRFTGHAMRSRPEPGRLRVWAESGRDLAESSIGLLQHTDLPASELVHFVARRSGLPEARLKIEGLDEVGQETFVVEKFVMGVHVSRVVTGPEVTIMPIESKSAPDDLLASSLPTIVGRWGAPTARVKTTVEARFLFDAQELGVAQIGVALDALLATAVYGFGKDPWGRDLSFNREELRARPSVIPVAFAIGLTTGKRILTSTEGHPLETRLDVDAAFERWSDILNAHPSGEVSRALRALRDAADESRDVFERCHAMSAALEYYASKSRPGKVVSKRAKSGAIEALESVDMTVVERQRLTDLIEGANNPPLMAKVRHQAKTDRVPLSVAEWDVITTLRSIRNRTVHGRAPTQGLPDSNRLRWGVSITARLILFRWAAEAPTEKPAVPEPAEG